MWLPLAVLWLVPRANWAQVSAFHTCKCDYRLRYCDAIFWRFDELIFLANVITACGIVTLHKMAKALKMLGLANVITACGIVTFQPRLVFFQPRLLQMWLPLAVLWRHLQQISSLQVCSCKCDYRLRYCDSWSFLRAFAFALQMWLPLAVLWPNKTALTFLNTLFTCKCDYRLRYCDSLFRWKGHNEKHLQMWLPLAVLWPHNFFVGESGVLPCKCDYRLRYCDALLKRLIFAASTNLQMWLPLAVLWLHKLYKFFIRQYLQMWLPLAVLWLNYCFVHYKTFTSCKCDYRLRYCDPQELSTEEDDLLTCKCDYRLRYCDYHCWSSFFQIKLANVITACGIVTQTSKDFCLFEILLANVISACGIKKKIWRQIKSRLLKKASVFLLYFYF